MPTTGNLAESIELYILKMFIPEPMKESTGLTQPYAQRTTALASLAIKKH